MKFILVLFFALAFFNTNAQTKKQWAKNYWAGGNINVLLGNPYTGVGFNINAGKKLSKGINVGMGYGYNEFSEIDKASIIHLIVEKDIAVGKKALFFNIKPGLAIPINPNEQYLSWSNSGWGRGGWWWGLSQFDQAKTGLNLQCNAGIKWLIGKHNYFLSAGYNSTNYQLLGFKEVNDVNGIATEKLQQDYKIKNNKLMISLGFTL